MTTEKAALAKLDAIHVKMTDVSEEDVISLLSRSDSVTLGAETDTHSILGFRVSSQEASQRGQDYALTQTA